MRPNKRQYRLAQSARRAVCIIWILAVVGMILFVFLFVGRENGREAPWVAAFVVYLVSWVILRTVTGAVTERPESHLDERQIDIRAHWIFYGLQMAVISGVIIAVLLLFVDPGLLDNKQIAYLLLTLILASASVPTMLHAWTERDDDDEE